MVKKSHLMSDDGKCDGCENCCFKCQRRRILKQNLDIIEEKIADFQAEKNYILIREHVENLIDDTDNLKTCDTFTATKGALQKHL